MASAKDIASWVQQGAEALARGDAAAAADRYRRVLTAAPDHPQALWMLGMLELDRGRVDAAVPHVEHLVRTQPHSAHAHYALGRVRAMQERLADADACFRTALALDASHLPSLVGLGVAMAEAGNLGGAETVLRQAVAAHPRVPEVRIQLGRVLCLMNRMEAARAEYETAADLAPNSPETARTLTGFYLDRRLWAEALRVSERWARLEPNDARPHSAMGSALLNLQQTDRADAAFDRALRLNPPGYHVQLGKIGVLRVKGELEAACRLIVPLLPDAGGAPAVLVIYARIADAADRQDDALSRIEQVLADGGVSDYQRRELCFAAGELLDKKGDYDRAFEHYREGNSIAYGTFVPETFRRFVDRQIEVFGSGNVQRLAHARNRIERPVLIVGMPRSGTSLVEQILSSHPRVHGAGELMHIQQIAVSRIPAFSPTGQPYPECVRDLTHGELDRLAREYDMDLARLGGNALRVTDKMPLNCLHLGLIHLMLPQVRVIHCRRNPVDTCLSNYFQNFAAPEQAFSNDLLHLGFFYRQYERLMAHWREVLDLPMLEVDYEELVADQEGMSRKMVAFIGLEWDDACLQFHKSRRTVSTASATQVRKPIYKRSVERWRRYEKHLGPLLEALGIKD